MQQMPLPEEIAEFISKLKEIKPKFNSENKASELITKLEGKIDENLLEYIFQAMDPDMNYLDLPLAVCDALRADDEEFGTEPRAAIYNAIKLINTIEV